MSHPRIAVGAMVSHVVLCLLGVGVSACSAVTQPSLAADTAFEVPKIVSAPSGEAPEMAALTQTTARSVDGATVFNVVFEGAPSPLSSMRMVVAPGGSERAVELAGDELTLTGTAESIPGGDRWLVGVCGMYADDSAVVVRMTAELDGDRLRGWAVIDAEGKAVELPFVALPSS